MIIDYPISLEKARLLIKEDIDVLISMANFLRQKHKKNIIFTCAIINAKSGACSENCAFCAQSSHNNTNINIYPLLSKDKILAKADEMKRNGATRFSIVTSGYKLKMREVDLIADIIKSINEKIGIKVCASLGMLDENMAKILKDSGLDRYHHNLETARSFFQNICTTHSYDEDIETLYMVKKVGLKLCSGGIIGLGETWTHRLELAFTLRNINVDSIPINFLNPIPGTKLQYMPLISSSDALRSIALFRIINPDKDIGICGGREKILNKLQYKIFFAGANGIMIGNYLTTKGRSIKEDMEMIRNLGLILEDNE